MELQIESEVDNISSNRWLWMVNHVSDNEQVRSAEPMSDEKEFYHSLLRFLDRCFLQSLASLSNSFKGVMNNNLKSALHCTASLH